MINIARNSKNIHFTNTLCASHGTFSQLKPSYFVQNKMHQQHIQMNSSTTSCIEFHHRQIWFQLLYAIILYTYWINDFNTPDDDDSMNYVFMILTFKHLHFDKSIRLILEIYDMAQHECARLKSIQCTIICLWLFFVSTYHDKCRKYYD